MRFRLSAAPFLEGVLEGFLWRVEAKHWGRLIRGSRQGHPEAKSFRTGLREGWGVGVSWRVVVFGAYRV